MSSTVPPHLLKEILNQNELNSKKNILWQCEKEHKWEATLSSRINGTSCPVCANKKVLTGFNDLLTVAPLLAAQWHPTKNGELTPNQIVYGSTKKVWWQCEKEHEWETSVEHRYHKKSKCPFCSNSKVWTGFNDLQTKFPNVAAQWHSVKNGELTPNQVVYGSHKKVWWICVEGHEWETSIVKRTGSKRNCPFCANQRTIEGVNDLASSYPEIAAQWNKEKNGLTVLPEKIHKNSNKKVWWLCGEGHEWETSIAKRTSSKQNCPFCANQKVLKGFNDLASNYPEIAAQWHPTRNGELTPGMLVSGSNKKVWWQCENNHEWQTMPRERLKYGCPKCPTRSSKPEQEITSFLMNLNGNIVVENSVRKIVPGYELDIYIPEKKVAVEFNGLYWHSEARGRGKYYHHGKWQACKDKNIQLIQIWEDDWNHNPELVKRMLAHKIQARTETKVYARDTFVRDLTVEDTVTFFNKYHIQGSVHGGIRVGLFEKKSGGKEPVAVMVLKREPGTEGKTLNLLRYATSKNAVGGFTKLLKYVERQYIPEKIITFSDNTVSDGALYENNGFVATKELEPDYMYIVKGTRKHKFGYRLKRFRNDPNLQYKQGLTERELASLNNLVRIWDAGKTKWEKTVIY